MNKTYSVSWSNSYLQPLSLKIKFILLLYLSSLILFIGITGLLLDRSNNYLYYFGISVIVSGIFTGIAETFLVSRGIVALVKLKKIQNAARLEHGNIELVSAHMYLPILYISRVLRTYIRIVLSMIQFITLEKKTRYWKLIYKCRQDLMNFIYFWDLRFST